MCIEAGTQAVRYTASRGYFESLTTVVVWRVLQTTSKVVYISASARSCPSDAHGIGHVTLARMI